MFVFIVSVVTIVTIVGLAAYELWTTQSKNSDPPCW